MANTPSPFVVKGESRAEPKSEVRQGDLTKKILRPLVLVVGQVAYWPPPYKGGLLFCFNQVIYKSVVEYFK